MAAGEGWTRRAVLSSFAALTARADSEKGQLFPSERVRFLDSATEFPLLRLTDPSSHSCFLPAYYARMLPRQGSFLLYWSDRTGSAQAFRMDLKTGESRQLTAARDLDGSSLTLLENDHAFCYFDGPSLRLVTLSNLREKEIYHVADGAQRGPGFSVTPDGSQALFIEVREGVSQLRLVPLRRGAVKTLFASPVPLAHPVGNPRLDTLLYRQAPDSLWVIRYDGRANRSLAVAPGRTGPAFWSPDGNTVLYLSFPAERGKLNSIREVDPVANTDRLVSETSQFVHFAPNSDASVFAGASGNRAAPYILILLRRTRRELAVCEHRASDPARVEPVFSPDSQRIYFQSDRHGKPALYCVPVEGLVAGTGS